MSRPRNGQRPDLSVEAQMTRYGAPGQPDALMADEARLLVSYSPKAMGFF